MREENFWEKQTSVVSVRLIKDTQLLSDKLIRSPEDAVQLLRSGSGMCD